jgi:hypothetical protein
MILNISNHPKDKWQLAQVKEAVEKFGEIRDYPFPHISPFMPSSELDMLVLNTGSEIAMLCPQAVHIMGEMTFVFKLVTFLKKKGIRCIASTTSREVVEKGNKKTSSFNFVQFREY